MKLENLLKKEIQRQKQTINLIPSENYPSKRVLKGLSTIFATKYAEGYPKKRYYPGNEIIDSVEENVKNLALKVFGLDKDKWHINLQSYSGSPANLEIYFSVLKPKDKILSLKLSSGGHLSHGHKVTIISKIFNIVHYDLDKDGFLDYKNILKIAKKQRPKLIISGFTAYPRKIDFEKFHEIAREVGAYHFADISHISGFIIAREHQTPFDYADFVMTTTHKLLRGPRGAIIFCKSKFKEAIDRTVFPGVQGGPHIHTIYSIGLCLEEALKRSYKNYIKQVKKNAKILEKKLKYYGFNLVSGGTDTHLLLIDLRNFKISGKEAEKRLEEVNIIANRNTIPGDTTAFNPSGLRIGSPALTSRGLKEKDFEKIGEFLYQAILLKKPKKQLKKEIINFIKKFKIPSI